MVRLRRKQGSGALLMRAGGESILTMALERSMQDCDSEDFHVDLAGGRVFVRRWRPETLTDQAPIVLLHDSLGCVATWRDFPGQLARRLQRPVFAYDRLGFGQSSERHSPPSLDFIDDEARTVFPALCRSLGLKRVVPFGHSVGGGMAIAIASLNSQTGLCASVVTESAQAFVESRTIEGVLAARRLFGDPGQLAKLARFHGSRARWVLDAWTGTWLDPEFSNWSLDVHLEHVQCPVLAIHGDKDEYGSCAFPTRIAQGVAGYAEAVILEGFGHVPHRENPERVSAAVSEFLAKVEWHGPGFGGQL